MDELPNPAIATKNLDNSAKLLDIAEKSYKALKQRYVVGVGNIIELLNGQSSLNNAGRQRVEALTNWRMSRMHLAATLGRLGMWSLSSEKKRKIETPRKNSKVLSVMPVQQSITAQPAGFISCNYHS